MIYMRWGIGEITGLESTGLSHVVTACDAEGSVVQEIGFDGSGRPIHRAPDPSSRFFLFDGAKVGIAGQTVCMSAEQFASAWRDAGWCSPGPGRHR